jgi:hypothetical protein
MFLKFVKLFFGEIYEKDLFCICLFLSFNCFGDDDKNYLTMRNIGKLAPCLTVDQKSRNIVSEQRIKTMIEMKLRNYGFIYKSKCNSSYWENPYISTDANDCCDKGLFDVSITSVNDQNISCAYVEVSLESLTAFDLNGESVWCRLWPRYNSNGILLLYGDKYKLSRRIYDYISEQIDEVLNEYFKVNPRCCPVSTVHKRNM